MTRDRNGGAASELERAEDYCRSVLPRVSRTFALNIRLLSGSMRDAVQVAYLLCRAADALEDSWPGDAGAIRRRFERFSAALAGDERAAGELAEEAKGLAPGRADLDLLAHLPLVLQAFAELPEPDRRVISEGVEILATGMCRYASRAAERMRGDVELLPYLDTEVELHDYCWVVAGCVGVLLTRLFARRSRASAEVHARRLELAPKVGEALQLTNILLDWPIDVRRRRCHVPAAWLAEHGLTPRELIDSPSPDVCALAGRLETLARAALERVPEYLDLIPARHVRYRLFCLWPALWALGSLEQAHRDPAFPWGLSRPKLPRGALWRTALASLLAGHHRSTLRWLYSGTVGQPTFSVNAGSVGRAASRAAITRRR